ncbi:GIN domain-containing protein [Patescibacteria group bacterium]
MTTENEKAKTKSKPFCGPFTGDITGGLFLVFLGVIFLFNNLGIVPWEVWGSLWKFWPVLIILSGINHIMGKSVISRLLVAVVSLGTFAAIILYSVPQIATYVPYLPKLPGLKTIDVSTKPASENMTVDEFSKLSLEYPATVTLVRGEESEVSIKASEEDLKNIEVGVEDEKLFIKTKNKFTNLFDSKTEIVVTTTKDIDTILIAGSGNVWSKEALASEKLKLTVAGSGNIKMEVMSLDIESEIVGSGNIVLMGSSDSTKVKIVGSGNYSAYELEANSANIEIAGSGDAEVFVNESLDINTLGSGDVTYKGSPKVSQNVSGSGSVGQQE